MTLICQGVLNGFFHLNWIKRPSRLPRILIGAYTFAFIWYITSTLYYLGKSNYSNRINVPLMDNFALFSLAISLIFATFYLLSISPIKFPDPMDTDKETSIIVFPIHLVMYVSIIFLTGFLNLVLSFFS